MKTVYTKAYTRENTLFALQVWEKHQGRKLAQYLDENVPVSIFDVHKGVASVYYHENIFPIWQDLIAKKAATNPEVIEKLMDLYAQQIIRLEETWKRGILNSREELIDFFEFMSDTWIGVSVSYCLPETKNIDPRYQDLGMDLRKRSADFLDNTDKVIYKTLQSLYPHLGDLIKYISIEEIRKNKLPEQTELEARKEHYVYFGFTIYTHGNAFELAQTNNIEIIEDQVPEGLTELTGQIAMKGIVQGPVRVLHSKSQISTLVDGEILVTAMTTPDYLPAMDKAVAFVTDEGGITCHAAIVAREMKKPCVIGTKIATKALKSGDIIEVDANIGKVRILENAPASNKAPF